MPGEWPQLQTALLGKGGRGLPPPSLTNGLGMGWSPSGPVSRFPSQLTEGRGLAHPLAPSAHSQVKAREIDQGASDSAEGEEQLVMPHEGGSALGSDPLLTSRLLLKSQNLIH